MCCFRLYPSVYGVIIGQLILCTQGVSTLERQYIELVRYCQGYQSGQVPPELPFGFLVQWLRYIIQICCSWMEFLPDVSIYPLH